ncbi:hypothetical protein [uncultured Cyclobacterium sp.]|uniref:hypothetical protein n=1 Tax=uncultured Cyclobacterium sp. TaxID=453820 RepID=UPI0030EF9204|tara:strand:+ start:89785 stop:90669 length:885 start_codon:yes stop_codon:yes gene_type:complete
MKTSIGIFFLAFFILPKMLQGQDTWLLKSAENNVPIPYAKVTEVNSLQWTSSNSQGEFQLDSSLFTDGATFSISAMGYGDTLVSLDRIKKSKLVLLRSRYVEMEEHLVVSKLLKKQEIGHLDLPFSFSKSEGRRQAPITTNRYAVYVEFPRKGTKLLSKLSYYLSELGDPNPTITLRVLVSDEIKKPKEGRIYRISQFKDIKFQSQSLYESQGYGWSEIDLSQDEIIIPEKYKGAFLIFDLMDKGKQIQESLVIPFQNKSREKLHAGFYQTSGILGVYNKNNDHFAVVLEYLTE